MAPPTQQPKGLAARAAHRSAGHRKTAIVGWLAFVVIAFMIGGAVGQKKIADQDQGNGSSRAADRAIAKADFPDKADEQVLVQGRGNVRIGSAQLTAGIKDVVNRLEHTPNVVDVKSPLAKGNQGQLSKDGRSALVSFSIPGKDDTAKARVTASLAATAAAQKAHPELRIEQFGDASADKALSKMFSDDFSRAQKISLPLTLVILVVAFGALMAAGVPLLLGMTAVFATLGLIAPISQLIPVDDSVSEVILLIGLAVGVDYSMFYVRRKMEETDAGRSEAEALEFAAATSGRAVLISGLTVMIAMAGMFFAGNVTFTSFAVGTSLVVAVAMLGSLTVLPAVLSKLGRRVELGKVPFLAGMRHRNHGDGASAGRAPG